MVFVINICKNKAYGLAISVVPDQYCGHTGFENDLHCSACSKNVFCDRMAHCVEHDQTAQVHRLIWI
jgi:hypothetical protein